MHFKFIPLGKLHLNKHRQTPQAKVLRISKRQSGVHGVKLKQGAHRSRGLYITRIQGKTQPQTKLMTTSRRNTESDPESLRADSCVSLWILRPGT